MIDIENAVFTKISSALTAAYPNITITGEPIGAPAEFPCVSIFEADSFSYGKTQDSCGNENHASVMYEAYVFSNKKSSRKTECKNIFKVVDDAMLSMGFSRKSKTPFIDGNIYRIVGRYEAVVSKDKIIYRR